MKTRQMLITATVPVTFLDSGINLPTFHLLTAYIGDVEILPHETSFLPPEEVHRRHAPPSQQPMQGPMNNDWPSPAMYGQAARSTRPSHTVDSRSLHTSAPAPLGDPAIISVGKGLSTPASSTGATDPSPSGVPRSAFNSQSRIPGFPMGAGTNESSRPVDGALLLQEIRKMDGFGHIQGSAGQESEAFAGSKDGVPPEIDHAGYGQHRSRAAVQHDFGAPGPPRGPDPGRPRAAANQSEASVAAAFESLSVGGDKENARKNWRLHRQRYRSEGWMPPPNDVSEPSGVGEPQQHNEGRRRTRREQGVYGSEGQAQPSGGSIRYDKVRSTSSGSYRSSNKKQPRRGRRPASGSNYTHEFADEGAAAIQARGDFDFAENLSKFDKRTVFGQIRAEADLKAGAGAGQRTTTTTPNRHGQQQYEPNPAMVPAGRPVPGQAAPTPTETQTARPASRDATEMHGLGEFDFAKNHTKFDKKRVFERIKAGRGA